MIVPTKFEGKLKIGPLSSTFLQIFLGVLLVHPKILSEKLKTESPEVGPGTERVKTCTATLLKGLIRRHLLYLIVFLDEYSTERYSCIF